MKATFLYADRSSRPNTSHYRIFIPARYLQRAGHTIAVHPHDDLPPDHVFDTVLIERVVSEAMVDSLRGMGARRILVTFDDAYHRIPATSRSHRYWKGDIRGIDEFRRVLRLVDGAIVPSQTLADDFGATVVRNFHDPELWNFPRQRSVSDKLVIGWGGSEGHKETWRSTGLVGALRHLLEKYPEVELSIYGDAAVDELFTAGVSFKASEWVDFEEWPRRVCEFDIALAPLAGVYDTRRSNLKLIEAGLAGIPFVASGVGEYLGAPGGLLVTPDTQKGWYRALEKLVSNSSLRRSLGDLGAEWARGYLMPAHVADYEHALWPEQFA